MTFARLSAAVSILCLGLTACTPLAHAPGWNPPGQLQADRHREAGPSSGDYAASWIEEEEDTVPLPR